VLQGILPIYHYRDVKYIDWDPAPAEIDDLKNAIIANAVDRIHGVQDYGSKNALEKLTSSMCPVKYLPFAQHILKRIWNMRHAF
jgi:hypothetical protein